VGSWDVNTVVRRVLPNGLRVVLVPDHRAPLVAMDLMYRVGARDAPDAPLGIAMLVPRLMVRATAHLREGDYDRYLDAAGGFDSAWSVNLDRTIFRVTVPAEQVEPIGWPPR